MKIQKMKNLTNWKKRKKDGMKNWPKNQISDSMFSRGKTYVFPLETKSTIWKNDKKRLKDKIELKT
mgnify:CR=1 FL=1